MRDAGNLLTRAGLMIPSVDLDEVTVHYSDPDGLVQHIRYSPSLALPLLNQASVFTGLTIPVPVEETCIDPSYDREKGAEEGMRMQHSRSCVVFTG